ncbi:uncharacterized protein LOC131010687 [Salvia miltiorrhiza]|uniref:uncharacterized protein LOC131010687 n=1 Tax=Salvia miltiorrhiza TaxID=226208 RepID=UPI0025AC17E3|nr:uncharacterized protein LOC131010687 [Salvia miltiorrhiza]
MSWLARSIADSLRLDDEEEDATAAAAVEEAMKPVEDSVPRPTANDTMLQEDHPRDSAFSIEDRRSDSDGGASGNHGVDEDVEGDYDRRGVKEDLSEFRESLTRQFWGVASFLAPPPPPPPPPPLFNRSSIQLESDLAGSVNADEEGEEELLEYDERESGQSGESANSSQSKDDDEDTLEDAVGITEEVLAFARNIAHHPETWLDFPIEEEEFDDFDISEAQYKHALAIEHLAPRLAALRFELCPVHMGVGYFWMVYFVLLHSRLNKHDANLLSSPQLVQARAVWMHELQKQTKGDSYWSGISSFQSKGSTDSPRENIVCTYDDVQYGNESDWRSVSESSTHQMAAEHEIEKHVLDEIEFVDKSVIKEDPPPKLLDKEIVVGSSIEIPMPVVVVVTNDDDDDDEDAWLKDDSDLIGYTGTSLSLNEDDISFSDLEDDLDSTLPYKYKTSSTERSRTTKTP